MIVKNINLPLVDVQMENDEARRLKIYLDITIEMLFRQTHDLTKGDVVDVAQKLLEQLKFNGH